MIIHLKKPFFAAAVCIFSAASFAAERLALVIGNSNYSAEVGALKNPHYDATRIAERLEQLGFQVTRHENLSRDALGREVVLFRQKISPNTEVAMLFYAGHGVEIEGKSYLVPTDFRLEDNPEYPVKDQYVKKSIEARYLIDDIAKAGAQSNIMVFDACRNIPSLRGNNTFYISNRQLRSHNVLIAYSTQSGSTADDGAAGQNSPYTRALLKYLGTPNLSLLETFNAANGEVNGKSQRAEITFTSIPKVILNPVASAAAAPAPVIQPPKKPPVNPDAWMEKIWAWADEFEIPTEEVPRNKKELLAMTELKIYRLNSKFTDYKYKSYPKITYLPPEIGQLKNLQELDLYNNRLKTLPPEIGQLRNLRTLYLSENELQTLPAEIGQLSNLQKLYINRIQLQSLPKTFIRLNNLNTLWIQGNPQLRLTHAQRQFIRGIKNVER